MRHTAREQAQDIRAIEAAAARWHVRLGDHPVSATTESEFDAWLAQAAEHRACFMRCEVALAATLDLQDDAAFRSDIDDCARIAARDAAQGPAKAPLAPLRPHWIRAGAALLALAGIGGYLFLKTQPSEIYQTRVGERRSIVLPDRSTVTLNTDTRIAVALGAGLRRVDLLRGEAFFAVAHDPARPFEVHAAGGLVRAVGTQFGVQVAHDGVTVSVLEGAVVVIPQASSGEPAPGRAGAPRLEANRALRYRAGAQLGGVQPADVRRITAWREGRLVFDDVPLSAAMEEYNRYTDRKVLIGTPDIGRRSVSGVLDIGDSKSLDFLLRESLALRVVEQADAVLLLDPEKRDVGGENDR